MIDADIHTLTGAYALDAVIDAERLDIELHLAECPTCALEADEFAGTAARLGTMLAVVPPAALRGQVLSEIRRTRQLSGRIVRFAIGMKQLRVRWVRQVTGRR